MAPAALTAALAGTKAAGIVRVAFSCLPQE